MNELEKRLRPLLAPIARNGGEYLRPWMTTSTQPERCKVWLVGANPAKTFPASLVGPFDDYMDALFNRNGKAIRELYDEITGGRPSPTRRNLDRASAELAIHGIHDVLETNLNCYPTRMSADLNDPTRREGRDRGEQIFSMMLETIQPQVIWLHGSGAQKTFRRRYQKTLPRRQQHNSWSMHDARGRLFVLTPSFAPPAFNSWTRSFDETLVDACAAIKERHGCQPTYRTHYRDVKKTS